MISNFIQIGNKVDICPVQQIEQEKITGVRAHIYKSQVTNIHADDVLELSMPTEAGKMVLLPIGIRFEFVFYSMSGLYRGMGLVEERYKADNMYMIRVSLKSQLHKYQRREYYRMPCIIRMSYYDITLEQAVNLPTEHFRVLVGLPEIEMTKREASIVDISGGGIRFISDTKNKEEACIVIEVKLQSTDESGTYLIPAHILSSKKTQKDRDRFENRAEFILRDRKIREEIIRFIFDEERKNRKKEVQ